MTEKVDNNEYNPNDVQLFEIFQKECNEFHSVCRSAKKFVLKVVKQGDKFNPKMTDRYIKYLYEGTRIYTQAEGWNYCYFNINEHSEPLFALLKFSYPDKTSMEWLIWYDYTNVIEKVIENKFCIDEQILDYCFSRYEELKIRNFSKNNERWAIEEIICKICYYLKNNKALLRCKRTKMALLNDKELNLLILEQNEPTYQLLKMTIETNNLELTDKLINMGIEIDESLLVIACSKGNYEIIKKLLDLKVIPTKECFDNLCQFEYPRIGKIYNYTQPLVLIELLLQYGYYLTYDDLKYAIKYKICIDNYKNYDIKLDDGIYEECSKAGRYMYPLKDMVLTNKSLLVACSIRKNLPQIRTLIKLGLQPDSKCFQRACSQIKNMDVIRFLLKKGIHLNDDEKREIKLIIGEYNFNRLALN